MDQGEFYGQLTRTLTPHALRESNREGNGGLGGDISTWVCDFIFGVAGVLEFCFMIIGCSTAAPYQGECFIREVSGTGTAEVLERYLLSQSLTLGCWTVQYPRRHCSGGALNGSPRLYCGCSDKPRYPPRRMGEKEAARWALPQRGYALPSLFHFQSLSEPGHPTFL